MKLSTKISIVLIIVVSLSGLVIGGLTINSTERSFDQYLLETRQADLNEWETIYLNYYRTHDNSWLGVRRLMSIQWEELYSNTQGSYLRPIVLVSLDGTILAHPQASLIGLRVSKEVLKHAISLKDNEKDIAYMLPIDYFNHKFWVLESNFSKNVTHSLVSGIIATSIFAVLIGLWLSGNLVRPLKQLIAGVRMMNKGDEFQHIPVEGKDEIGELTVAFNQMASEIKHNHQVRVRFFADVSHELRTPLTAIAGKLENQLMKNEDLKPEAISAIYDEVLRLNNLVNELQNLSKIDAGQLHISKTLINIKDFLADYMFIVEAEAATKNIQIHLEIPDKIDYCYADPQRLKQIILNLLSNALRYTKDGGHINVRFWEEGEQTYFSIADTGVGMTDEDMQHIFDRFYRSDRSRARATGGSGLGLAITKGLVEALNGSIQVTSEKNVGTEFIIGLPKYIPEQDDM